MSRKNPETMVLDFSLQRTSYDCVTWFFVVVFCKLGPFLSFFKKAKMGGSFHFQDRMAATPSLYFNCLSIEMTVATGQHGPT